jgi:hypothetical protein
MRQRAGNAPPVRFHHHIHIGGLVGYDDVEACLALLEIEAQ